MGRIFGLILIVCAIWVASEVYTKGLGGAFGGAFAREGESPEAVARSRHAAQAFQRAYNKSESRVDTALSKEP
jgi:hypothetical protein